MASIMPDEFCWKVELFFRRILCWFTEHKEVSGEHWNYAPDYCNRCFIDWPQDQKTLTSYLNVVYCWFVQRDWKWFERLDWWLCKKYGRFLPHWWEY